MNLAEFSKKKSIKNRTIFDNKKNFLENSNISFKRG